jgi:superfamily I DNA and RNA helicase
MLKFVRTVPKSGAAQMVERWLSECFDHTEGVCYYKHPAIVTNTGVIPDFVLFTKAYQPLVVRIIGCQLQDINVVEEDRWMMNDIFVDSPLQELRDLVVKLNNRFEDQRKLRDRLHIQAIIALPFISKSDFEEEFGPLPGNVSVLWAHGVTDGLQYQLEHELSDEEWTLTRSVIQGATHLHKSSRDVSPNITTLRDAIKELDKQIAALDDEQERVALEIAPGPQRIRGLAGTGKTVLLAMKAAHIHILYPNAKILFTFHTQSLYNQIIELISKTYRAHKGSDPDWDLLHVRHSWGGRSRPGVYSDLCGRQGVTPLDLRMARSIDRQKEPFQVCCEHALQLSIWPEYDFILVDEAQDLPKEFFRVLYQLLNEPKRIYWAYDELQSLSSLEIPKPEDLFGVGKDGKPLVSFDGEDYEGPIQKDFVLHRSYRCPLDVLMLAHAIGLGIYNPTGPVQMLEDQGYWEAIGYEIESGKLQKGQQVVISRDAKNSPNPIYELYNKQKLITVSAFPSREAELDEVARSIARDISQEGVAPRQIMVITLNSARAKEYLTGLQRRLVQQNIASIIPGLLDDTSSFAEAGKVTLSTVFRAKGNEAHIVYILSFDSLYDYLQGIGNRNRAFASITRSKAWVRITGTGGNMGKATDEINRILADLPRFKFKFPDMKKIRRLDAEDSYRRRKVATANNAVDVLVKTETEALAALVSNKPEVREALEALQKLISEALSENQ